MTKPSTPNQAQALGLKIISAGGGRARVSLPFQADLVGDPVTGVVAGGVITTLLDHTCGAAIFAMVGPAVQATLDLRIDYMHPAKPGVEIIAEAHCYKLTRSVAFLRAVAHHGDPDNPIAAAQGAFMMAAAAKGSE